MQSLDGHSKNGERGELGQEERRQSGGNRLCLVNDKRQ